MSTVGGSWTEIESSPFDAQTFVRIWFLALAAYGVGDIVTTIALVWFSGAHVEANPLVAAAILHFGGAGLVALKLASFYLLLGVSLWAGLRAEDGLVFYGAPTVLVVLGLFLTGHNIVLLLP